MTKCVSHHFGTIKAGKSLLRRQTYHYQYTCSDFVEFGQPLRTNFARNPRSITVTHIILKDLISRNERIDSIIMAPNDFIKP